MKPSLSIPKTPRPPVLFCSVSAETLQIILYLLVHRNLQKQNTPPFLKRQQWWLDPRRTSQKEQTPKVTLDSQCTGRNQKLVSESGSRTQG